MMEGNDEPQSSNPVPLSLFDHYTHPLRIEDIKNNEDKINCSICFEIMACNPNTVDSLSKEEIKILKNTFGITEPELTDIKRQLKE